MKNKKGFTLVELLAVIAILGIIVTITVVSVSGTINRSTDNAIKLQKESIISAAKAYVTDHLSEISDGTTKNITLENLIEEAYLNEVKDPNNDEKTCDYNRSWVKVTRNGYKYTYDITLICNGTTY